MRGNPAPLLRGGCESSRAVGPATGFDGVRPIVNPAINLALIPRSALRLIAAKVGTHATSLWINAEAIRVTKCELEQILLRDLANSGAKEFDLTRAVQNTAPTLAGDFGKRLAAAREAHALVAASPAYLAACAVVDPLLIEATTQARKDNWQKPWEI